MSDEKKPLQFFEEEIDGLRCYYSALIASTLAETLARSDDLDHYRKHKIAVTFWKILLDNGFITQYASKDYVLIKKGLKTLSLLSHLT